MDLEKLVAMFKQEFQFPFCPEGLVQARMNEDGTMRLQIGARDIQMDENGDVVGAGTAFDSSVSVEQMLKNTN